jgi:hypothetical protein
MKKKEAVDLKNSLSDMSLEADYEVIDNGEQLPDNNWNACIGTEIMVIKLSSKAYAHNLPSEQGLNTAAIMLHSNKSTGISCKLSNVIAGSYHFTCSGTQNHTENSTVEGDIFGVALCTRIPDKDWQPSHSVSFKTFTTTADWKNYTCDLTVPQNGDYFLVLFGVPQKESSTGALVTGVSLEVSGAAGRLELTPSPLVMIARSTTDMTINYQYSGQPVPTATLTIAANPDNLFTGLVKTVTVQAGAGKFRVTAGTQPTTGTLTVTDPQTGINQNVGVTVNATQTNVDRLSLLTPHDYHVVTRQQTPVRIQYLDRNSVSLTGKPISATIASGTGIDIKPSSPVITKASSDGTVYAGFEVNVQQDGELKLTFSAPNVDDLLIPLTAGLAQQTQKLTVSPASLTLPVENITRLDTPITITPSQTMSGEIGFSIAPDEGLYIVVDENNLATGNLKLADNQAQIYTLKTSDRTGEFKVDFSAPDYTGTSLSVTVDNGNNILMFPNETLNSIQSPQRIETLWKGVPQNFYIKVLDAAKNPVDKAKYQFILATSSGDRTLGFAANGTRLSDVCISDSSGVIAVPAIMVGNQTGAFTLSVVSAAANATTLGTWYFTVTTVLPIKMIKFESNLGSITVKPVTQCAAGQNSVQAFVDSSGVEKAVSGQIIFTLSDTGDTGTRFTDYDTASNGLKKTVRVGLTGEVNIPAFITGTSGEFRVIATATGLAISAITQTFEIKN